MKNPIKRVAAIHDLSGFGTASLTAIIPILSNMGIQVCPLPTAILSTHTGGFDNFSFVDLTDSMEKYIEHWKSINLEFECIYSGFLGSTKQIGIVENFIDIFKNESNIVVVDPVMGDNERLYATMENEIVQCMRRLIRKANIITPNFTEAMFLLEKEFKKDISKKEIKQWIKELSDFGPEVVILTSVPNVDKDEKDKACVVAYDKRVDKYWKITSNYIPAQYPGTGDIFTSVIVGSLLQGDSIPIAIERAVSFVFNTIKESYGFDYPNRDGVLLEKSLKNLNVTSNCNYEPY